jgi:hypothetical protein
VKAPRRQFDPQVFLAKVGTGKTILNYRKGRIIYAQGKRLIRFLHPIGRGQGDRRFRAGQRR